MIQGSIRGSLHQLESCDKIFVAPIRDKIVKQCKVIRASLSGMHLKWGWGRSKACFKHLVLQSTNSGDGKLTSNEQLLLIKPLKTLNMLTCFNTAKLRVMGGQWISISAFEWVGFHCEIGSTQLLNANIYNVAQFWYFFYSLLLYFGLERFKNKKGVVCTQLILRIKTYNCERMEQLSVCRFSRTNRWV